MSTLTTALQNVISEERDEFIHDTKRWYSAPEFRKNVEAVTALLRQAGFKPGDAVVLAYPNSYSFTVIYVAALLYGIVLAPIHPEMPNLELRTFLQNSHAVGGFFLPHHASLISNLGNNDRDISLHTAFIQSTDDEVVPSHAVRIPTSGFGDERFGVCHSEDQVSPHTPSDDSIAILLFTSGTTGRPKAVGLKHRHLLAACTNVIGAHELTQKDVSYCFLPLFHINAQVVALLSTWLSGGKVIVAPKFSASRFWSTITEHGVTWVSAVPTIIAILSNSPQPTKIPQTLRFVRSASAQLPVLHARKFERMTGIPIIESYGMTEAASQICVNPIPPSEHRLGSVGLPRGLELQIVDGGNNPVPPRTVGEVVIRGDSVIEMYVQAETQNDFKGGWFHTGDLGYVDDEGFVYLTGRKKEMINRAGEKISPYEVEDVVRQHELVNQVAVIGLPDTLYGEKIVAYVTTYKPIQDEGEFAREIEAHCKLHLSRFKCPSEVIVVSQFPVGPTGKIQRTRLRDSVLKAATS